MNVELDLEKLTGLWFFSGILLGILLGLVFSRVSRMVKKLTEDKGEEVNGKV